MTYEKIKATCHVRSSIYRISKPDIRYAKNHSLAFDVRVPLQDQLANDWKEYDPNDFYNTSLGAESY